METLCLYVSSAWTHLAENTLHIDPNKRLCTFRLKVLLTTLTVCGMLFGAAGFAVLGRTNSNDRLPHAPRIIRIIEASDLAKVINDSSTVTTVGHEDKMQENTSTEAPDVETTSTDDTPTDSITDDGYDSPSTTPTVSTTSAAHKEDRMDGFSVDGHKKKDSRKGVLKVLSKDFPTTPSTRSNKMGIESVHNGRQVKIKPNPGPEKGGFQSKSLRVVTTRKPIKRLISAFKLSTPKSRGFPPRLRKSTTKRPAKKTLVNNNSWRRASKWPRKSTYPPRIFRTSTPRPWSSASDRRHRISDWLAKFISKFKAYFCPRVCSINPAYGGHFCKCDEPPMDCDDQTLQEYSINELKMLWSLVIAATKKAQSP